MNTPKISIVLAVYNGMPYLPETVESLRAQTFRDFELVLIDDGSTDDTARYIRAVEDPRIVYRRNEQKGFVNALNYGLRVARAELVARIDADDVALPTRLERQYLHLGANPLCLLVGCDFEEIDDRGEVIGTSVYRYTSDHALRWLLLLSNPMIHPGVMFRRKEVVRLGGYRQEYESAEDYDLWTRLCAIGEIANLPDKLVQKRGHPASMSVVRREIQLGHAVAIASNYSRNCYPHLNPTIVGSLHRFLIDRKPPPIPISRLVQEFEVIARLTEPWSSSPKDEVITAVCQVRSYLGWLCQLVARQNWTRPRLALSYLHAGSRLDPETRSLGRLIARQWKRLVAPRFHRDAVSLVI